MTRSTRMLPLFAVSSKSGDGIDRLAAFIAEQIEKAKA